VSTDKVGDNWFEGELPVVLLEVLWRADLGGWEAREDSLEKGLDGLNASGNIWRHTITPDVDQCASPSPLLPKVNGRVLHEG